MAIMKKEGGDVNCTTTSLYRDFESVLLLQITSTTHKFKHFLICAIFHMVLIEFNTVW
jgi:hypothetical protein